MSQRNILFQRIISSDGRSIAEARSEVITVGTNKTVSPQSVTVTVSSKGTTRSASSCSTSFSSQRAASS